MHEPWLEWAGRREEDHRGHFAVDPVALHIHERLSAKAIIQTARREDIQRDMFADPRQPYSEAIKFYEHDVDWANRLILGDCAQVMASLGRREGLSGKIQMVYMDPPYGIKFASNFQPLIGKPLSAGASSDKDLTREAETVRAYRDTWRLGKHSYLSYLRDRLIVARELLKPSGSIFLQINDENCHLVRLVMDDVFGPTNFVSQISFQTTSGFNTKTIATLGDYLLWYAREKDELKVRKVFAEQPTVLGKGNARWVLLSDRTYRGVRAAERRGETQIPQDGLLYKPGDLQSQGSAADDQPFEHNGRLYRPSSSSHWKANYPVGMQRLAGADRIHVAKNSIQYRRFATDYPYTERGNIWTDTITGSFTEKKRFVVQTNTKVVERCLHLATDPGDLVLDPTCGSGTTAVVAEKWGRRWITIDTSRVSIAIARQRLLTAAFDLFATCQDDGSNSNPGAGLCYRSVPHTTLGGIATNQHLDPILARHEEVLGELLKAANGELSGITGTDRKRWNLPPHNRNRSKDAREKATVDVDSAAWFAWEVPFEVNDDWPHGLTQAVEAYRDAWRDRLKDVNDCIAANSEQERLVHDPEIVEDITRVSGPFTIEGVKPQELSAGADGLFGDEPTEWMEVLAEPRNATAYLSRMVQLLRSDGITFPGNRRSRFARIEPLFESGGGIGDLHAEGLWSDGDESAPDNVAVAFGPEHGPVTAEYVEALIRASRRYDHLVIAGFSFEPDASGIIQESAHSQLTIHQAYIRPDANSAMDGLLRNSARDQLFTVFGQPDIGVTMSGSEEWTCELRGVDIYDPVNGIVLATGASKVAAWFLDQDYDGRCFCVSQAFFPDKSAWKKIAKALNSAADPDAFAAFSGTRSLPFRAGKHARIAVKVIDPRGNEVMTIQRLHESEQE